MKTQNQERDKGWNFMRSLSPLVMIACRAGVSVPSTYMGGTRSATAPVDASILAIKKISEGPFSELFTRGIDELKDVIVQLQRTITRDIFESTAAVAFINHEPTSEEIEQNRDCFFVFKRDSEFCCAVKYHGGTEKTGPLNSFLPDPSRYGYYDKERVRMQVDNAVKYVPLLFDLSERLYQIEMKHREVLVDILNDLNRNVAEFSTNPKHQSSAFKIQLKTLAEKIKSITEKPITGRFIAMAYGPRGADIQRSDLKVRELVLALVDTYNDIKSTSKGKKISVGMFQFGGSTTAEMLRGLITEIQKKLGPFANYAFEIKSSSDEQITVSWKEEVSMQALGDRPSPPQLK